MYSIFLWGCIMHLIHNLLQENFHRDMQPVGDDTKAIWPVPGCMQAEAWSHTARTGTSKKKPGRSREEGTPRFCWPPVVKCMCKKIVEKV